MERKGGRIRNRIAGALDLPGDVVLDLPRITLIGNAEMSVENHRGLIEYSPQCVVIGLGEGQVVVRGEDLRIGSIVPEEITLSGRIASVGFEG